MFFSALRIPEDACSPPFNPKSSPHDVPVPTYVSAPKAIVPKRVIDLTTPGAWSDDQERLELEALAASSPSRDQIFDQQLADEAVARLNQSRASNE